MYCKTWSFKNEIILRIRKIRNTNETKNIQDYFNFIKKDSCNICVDSEVSGLKGRRFLLFDSLEGLYKRSPAPGCLTLDT